MPVLDQWISRDVVLIAWPTRCAWLILYKGCSDISTVALANRICRLCASAIWAIPSPTPLLLHPYPFSSSLSLLVVHPSTRLLSMRPNTALSHFIRLFKHFISLRSIHPFTSILLLPSAFTPILSHPSSCGPHSSAGLVDGSGAGRQGGAAAGSARSPAGALSDARRAESARCPESGVLLSESLTPCPAHQWATTTGPGSPPPEQAWGSMIPGPQRSGRAHV